MLVIAKAIESLLARLVGVLVFVWVFEIGGEVQGRKTLVVNFFFSESSAFRVFGTHNSVGS